MQRKYVDALLKEIRARGNAESATEKSVVSIFLGGGTPSILPAEWIREILKVVREIFRVNADAEISMEANPGTVDAEKLRIYREAGINRISFGCQSTEDEELKMLGRIHTWKEFMDGYLAARAAGFENINVDLMSGLPGQTLKSWEKSLRKIAELKPEHISAYSLILEEGTPMYENQDKYSFPDEDEERRMYEATWQILREYGYEQYEISNYSLPGKKCRHNLGYWIGTEYLGLGLGASSLMGNRRFANSSDPEEYLKNCCFPERLETGTEVLEREDRMSERMILGLRLMAGVSAREFEKDFGCSIQEQYGAVIEKYIEWKLLVWDGDRLRLTREGISVSNRVMAEFL